MMSNRCAWPAAFGLLVIALAGCSHRDTPLLSPAADDALVAGGSASEGSDRGGPIELGGARLELTTSDPGQVYMQSDRDPWLRQSWVTHATSFSVRVKNTAPRAVRDLQLLIAVPAMLPRNGWSVTVGDPGVVYSRPADFPHFRLKDSEYPEIPHQVYLPQGIARYAIVEGPARLDPGATWEVPIQLFRGTTKLFEVHFDAAGGGTWCAPASDVTAVPPIEENIARR